MKAATFGTGFAQTPIDISIHAAREGGDFERYILGNWVIAISIHAAREGGDTPCVLKREFCSISIHAAREGGDINALSVPSVGWKFQSTPPVKAATEDGKKGDFDI